MPLPQKPSTRLLVGQWLPTSLPSPHSPTPSSRLPTHCCWPRRPSTVPGWKPLQSAFLAPRTAGLARMPPLSSPPALFPPPPTLRPLLGEGASPHPSLQPSSPPRRLPCLGVPTRRPRIALYFCKAPMYFCKAPMYFCKAPMYFCRAACTLVRLPCTLVRLPCTFSLRLVGAHVLL